MSLKNLIKNKKAKVAVIGLGYVGLPLACTIAEAGFEVYGYDINADRVSQLNQGQSYIYAVTDKKLKSLIKKGLFQAGTDLNALENADIIEICVPTPLDKHREPDLKPVASTARMLAPILRKDQLIILESTTYPGTTREVLTLILERSGLKVGTDFKVGYSPEREDPGNKDYGIRQIPKVVGADDKETRDLLINYYGNFIDTVVPVSSLDTAEAVKITENVFRSVNIALVNELKVIYDAMGIDVWEVIEAAKTKPFGYMPFYPGPGLGGHCIPIDPFYLTYRARAFDIPTKFIELAGEINTTMPNFVIEKLVRGLDTHLQKGLSTSRILLVGMAYKGNVNDTRQSPALDIMARLQKRGARTDYYDAHIPILDHLEEHSEMEGRESIKLTKNTLKNYDAAVILTKHDGVNYDMIRKSVPIIVDTRNVYDISQSKKAAKTAHVIKA